MIRITPLCIVIFISFFLFLSFIYQDIDSGYISKFGYNSICVSVKGYPEKDKFDESQFNYKNGKFYVKAKTSFCLRAILPEGKTYGDLLKNFTSTRSDYTAEDAQEKMVWRIFTSHDEKGNKIYESFPPSSSDMQKELTYMTSEKELGFFTFPLHHDPAVLTWITSGVDWTDSENNFRLLVQNWLNNAKSGWQLYIVYTVGYLEVHHGNDRFIVDDPIMSVIVEVK